jgi:hypothetical protein
VKKYLNGENIMRPSNKLHIRLSRFWRIDDNQAVLDCKKNSKTFLEKVFVEILPGFFRS